MRINPQQTSAAGHERPRTRYDTRTRTRTRTAATVRIRVLDEYFSLERIRCLLRVKGVARVHAGRGVCRRQQVGAVSVVSAPV